VDDTLMTDPRLGVTPKRTSLGARYHRVPVINIHVH